MDSKELKKIIALARKNGIKQLKVDGVELSFLEEAVTKEKKFKANDSDTELKEQYTEEEILFYSVPNIGITEKEIN